MNKMKITTRLFCDSPWFSLLVLVFLHHVICASGVLLILDAKEGGVVYRELIPEYLDDVRTVSEGKHGFRFTVSVPRFMPAC